MSYITKEIALNLLEENMTPNHVILHCMAVAESSMNLALELNKYGYNLSIELIQGAAMVHDIARVYENHEEIGAKIIEEKGYIKEAAIIKEHMHYEITTNVREIKEIDIVCLGDRMVKESKYVGLELRMEYILNKWKDNKKAQNYIREKVKQQKKLLKEIEKIIDKSIDDIML